MNDLSVQVNMSRHRTMRRGRGFSIIELLVVVGIIVILLSILLFAMNRARRMGQRTNTQVLMTSIGQALTQFQGDTGYYPPVLGDDDWEIGMPPTELRDLFAPYDPNAVTNEEVISDWYSITTLAEYLIGYGPHEEDGWGFSPGSGPTMDWDAEKPAIGIRHPGDDGVWGASRFNLPRFGALENRMLTASGSPTSETSPINIDEGKRLGPYLQLKSDDLLAGITSAGDLVRPGEAGYNDTPVKVLLDYWGQPLRYYRQPYPTGRPGQAYRTIDRDGDGVHDPIGLAEVTVLRPYELQSGAQIQLHEDFEDANMDAFSSSELRTAEFAVFSSGPDQKVDDAVRVDEEQENRDNLVETGP